MTQHRTSIPAHEEDVCSQRSENRGHRNRSTPDRSTEEGPKNGRDQEGKKILAGLLIDRFLPLQEEWYEPIRSMQRDLARLKEQPHAPEPQK